MDQPQVLNKVLVGKLLLDEIKKKLLSNLLLLSLGSVFLLSQTGEQASSRIKTNLNKFYENEIS